MKYFFKHLHVVNEHRWNVFKLCCKAGFPWRGLTHDLSKYSIEEFRESVKYYKKSNGTYSPLLVAKKDVGYSTAWLHHFGRNKHHFEYWYDYAAPIQTPIIPFKYMVEMVCDRIAACKVYNKGHYKDSDPYDYFIKRKDGYMINPKMSKFLELVFIDLKDHGEKVLNKNKLLKIYNKCIK